MCNCEYCIKCESCGHSADEHIAGEGHCFRCHCGQFTNRIADAWEALPEPRFQSFKEFANKWCGTVQTATKN